MKQTSTNWLSNRSRLRLTATTVATATAGTMLLLPLLAACGTPASPGGDALSTSTPSATSPNTSASPTSPLPSRSAGSGSSIPSKDPGPLNLTITVSSQGAGTGTRWTLTCHPTGGTHPDPAAACAVLGARGENSLRQLPRNMMCTQVYGGEQSATIVGVWRGTKVQTTLNRTNGCQIARWDALVGLLPKGGVNATGVHM